MKLPYNVIQPCGKVLFAARGGKIHTFKLEDGSHVSAWSHPDVAKQQTSVQAAVAISETETSEKRQADELEQDDEPPAKKQRVQGDDGAEENDETKQDEAMDVDAPAEAEDEQLGREDQQQATRNQQKRKKKKAKKQAAQPATNQRKTNEIPLIVHLTTTSNGSHLVAVSGHDKTIWTFQVTGDGSLKQLSQRPMPKRPCDVLISPDNTIIISADKFGDVYTLPLLPSETAASDPSSARATPNPSAAPKPFKPEATNFTVHSARNRESLRQQHLQLARAEQAKKDAAAAAESSGQPPAFEHTLIIGHVSLLTAISLAQDDKGRRYIITADRDEHIRVSRYLPQAHVIEGFCLGHANFVNAMTVPEGRPELLVSGGGDSELFVWDWLRGKLLSRFDLLAEVQRIVEGTSRIAVTKLVSGVVKGQDGAAASSPVIFVLCEGVPALFVLDVSPGKSEITLQRTVPSTGNPLDLATVKDGQGSISRVLVTTDGGEDGTSPSQVCSLDHQNGDFVLSTSFQLQDELVSQDEPDLDEVEAHKVLRGAEDLRKSIMGLDQKGDELGEGADTPAE